MKEIEDKVRETVMRWKYKDGYVHFDDLIKELTSLIQQEKKDAVMGLFNFMLDQGLLNDKIQDNTKKIEQYIQGDTGKL